MNVDDEYGLRLLRSAQVPVLGFGSSADADVRAIETESSSAGSRVRAATPKGEATIETKLVGPFNVSNCLAALTVALQAGISLPVIERGLSEPGAVPGRFEARRRRSSRSPWWSTTPTPRTRYRTCSKRRGGWRTQAGAADRGVRSGRGQGLQEEAADGKRCRTLGRRRGRHLRQPQVRDPEAIIGPSSRAST